MFVRILKFIGVVTAGLWLMTGMAHAQAKGVLKATHGDWEIRCIEGTNDCVMSQIGKIAGGENALFVALRRLNGVKDRNGTTYAAVITVQTPLGILLPYGLRLKIDSDEVVPIPLSRCLPQFCIAETGTTNEFVNKMKRGNTAGFGFFLDKEVLVNISLRGFTKGFNSLTPVSQ